MSDTKQINDGGPAFPTVCETINEEPAKGMTLRDWFAGQALAGILAGADKMVADDELAKMSYWAADAMLAAKKEKA